MSLTADVVDNLLLKFAAKFDADIERIAAQSRDSITAEIFSIGLHDSGLHFTTRELDEMVENFDKLKDYIKPPLRLGHGEKQFFLGDSDSQPALGWVSSLKRQGRKLVATFTGVPQAMKEMIQRGNFKRLSSELYPAFQKTLAWQNLVDADPRVANATGHVLSAVSLLGAAVPFCKDLQDLNRVLACELHLADADPEALAVDYMPTADHDIPQDAWTQSVDVEVLSPEEASDVPSLVPGSLSLAVKAGWPGRGGAMAVMPGARGSWETSRPAMPHPERFSETDLSTTALDSQKFDTFLALVESLIKLNGGNRADETVRRAAVNDARKSAPELWPGDESAERIITSYLKNPDVDERSPVSDGQYVNHSELPTTHEESLQMAERARYVAVYGGTPDQVERARNARDAANGNRSGVVVQCAELPAEFTPPLYSTRDLALGAEMGDREGSRKWFDEVFLNAAKAKLNVNDNSDLYAAKRMTMLQRMASERVTLGDAKCFAEAKLMVTCTRVVPDGDATRLLTFSAQDQATATAIVMRERGDLVASQYGAPRVDASEATPEAVGDEQLERLLMRELKRQELPDTPANRGKLTLQCIEQNRIKWSNGR